MIIFLILGLLLGGLVIIFTFQNMTDVTVMFLSWSFEGSLALILALAVLSGILIASFLSLPDVFRRKFQVSKLKRHNEVLKEELAHKEVEVVEEKSKAAATNAYLDELEKTPPRV
jgi:uncharacterized integral membrane protein